MNTLSPDEKAAGWRLLFDGQSLTDWRASDAPGSFSVKDGAIVVRGVSALVARPGSQQQSLLGMSFLDRLRSFAVEDGRLVLRGR